MAKLILRKPEELMNLQQLLDLLEPFAKKNPDAYLAIQYYSDQEQRPVTEDVTGVHLDLAIGPTVTFVASELE